MGALLRLRKVRALPRHVFFFLFMFDRARNSRHRCELTLMLLASALYDNVYTHVNDELEAFQFLKDPTGRFSGASKSTKMLKYTASCVFVSLLTMYMY